MAVQLRSGKEVGNNSRKERKEETEEEQEETGNDEKKNMPENIIEARKQAQVTHLQCHFLRGFRKQGGKSSFLNSWTSSRK